MINPKLEENAAEINPNLKENAAERVFDLQPPKNDARPPVLRGGLGDVISTQCTRRQDVISPNPRNGGSRLQLFLKKWGSPI